MTTKPENQVAAPPGHVKPIDGVSNTGRRLYLNAFVGWQV